MEKNELTLRSSAAEFLIFEKQSHADSVDVIYQDGTLWMSQRMMGILFDVEPNTITYHLGEIYKIGELEEESTHRKIRVVQTEGTRSDDRDILTDAGKYQWKSQRIMPRVNMKSIELFRTDYLNRTLTD